MKNITKDEISKGYDAIANRIHHGLDMTFYKRVISMNSSYSGKILDVGCGGGDLLRMIAQKSEKDTEFFGLDISPKLCEIAKKNNPNAQIVVGDAEQLPYSDNTFDFVFMTETLEHLLDYKKAMIEVSRVLKPNGVFVVSVPNRDWLQYDFYKPFIDKHRFQPVQDHYFRVDELAGLLKNSNFEIKKFKGSDNLFYYGWKHHFEQVAAFFMPFLYKKMKRLIVKNVNVK